MKKLICVILLGLLSPILHAEDFKAGKDYEILQTPNIVSEQDQHIPVLEFFSYGCPWCYKLNAPLEKWAKSHSSQVSLSKVPVVFHPEWRIYAKAFYAARILNVEEKMTLALFAAIQEKKETLDTPKAMSEFFVRHDVDERTAQSAFTQSPTLDLKLKEGLQKMGHYHIQAVPAIVVNGQYKTDLSMAKSPKRFFKLLDFLVAKAESDRKNDRGD